MTTLEQAQKLTADDFSANRSGRLSVTQKRQLMQAVAVFAVIFGVAFVVIVGVMVASVFLVPNPLVVIVLFALPLYFVVRILINLRKSYVMRREEVNTGTVASVTGVVSRIHMTRGANLMVQDVQLFVPTSILEQINAGERCRVYYLPLSKTFIAIERINPPPKS